MAQNPPQRIIRWFTAEPMIDSMRDAHTMTLDVSGRRYEFVLPSMTGAIAAMKVCGDDLLRHWQIDAKQIHAESAHVAPSGAGPAAWFSSKDYPLSAIARGAGGRAVAVLSVDRDAAITECRLVERSGNAEIDQQTCARAKARATFKPARDGEGHPVASW